MCLLDMHAIVARESTCECDVRAAYVTNSSRLCTDWPAAGSIDCVRNVSVL